MKKILSLVLVIAMMASLVVFAAPAASADETVYTVEVTDATAAAGETVTLDVIVTGTTVFMFGFAIEYDTTRLANPVIKTNTELFGAGGPIAGADYQKSWTSNANDVTNGVDVSEGATVLTITFDVKADAPAGDAYVKCAPFKNDSKIYIGETDTKATGAKYDWTAIDGKVSILPEGYATATPESDAADFTYTDNGDGSATITHYDGTDADVVIPSVIDGLTVKALASYMFITATAQSNATVTSVTIPATVETIADYCMVNLSACTDIYVLNSAVVIGTAALAYDAALNVARGKITGVSDVWTKSADYVTPDTTIHGFAGSTADTFANTADGYGLAPGWAVYAAPSIVTVVAGSEENTYVVSDDQIAAPGAAIVDGKPVVAWKVNGAAVLPGAAVAINGDTTFEAMTVDMATVNGASMKVTDVQDELALRFTATINIADYAAIVEAFDGATISHGMLLVPQQYVARAGGFTHAALDALEIADGKGRYLDFQMTGCYETTDTDYVLVANVNGFKSATLAKNPKFNAVGYIAITIGEETTYVYSNYSTATSRDLKSVAQATLATTPQEADAYKWLEALITSITG